MDYFLLRVTSALRLLWNTDPDVVVFHGKWFIGKTGRDAPKQTQTFGALINCRDSGLLHTSDTFGKYQVYADGLKGGIRKTDKHKFQKKGRYKTKAVQTLTQTCIQNMRTEQPNASILLRHPARTEEGVPLRSSTRIQHVLCEAQKIQLIMSKHLRWKLKQAEDAFKEDLLV